MRGNSAININFVTIKQKMPIFYLKFIAHPKKVCTMRQFGKFLKVFTRQRVIIFSNVIELSLV
jgi:hypothetical protein